MTALSALSAHNSLLMLVQETGSILVIPSEVDNLLLYAQHLAAILHCCLRVQTQKTWLPGPSKGSYLGALCARRLEHKASRHT